MNDLSRELDLARQALDLVVPFFRQMLPGQITSKSDRDLVSETDTTIEARVRDFLTTQLPAIGFLGEEEGHQGNTDRFWVLDPVDGTSNYLRTIPLCGISLALVEEDTPVLGIVELPFFSSRYCARQGHGATVNDQPIQVSDRTNLHEAIVSTGDYAVGTDADRKNAPRLALAAVLADRAERVRMLGSAAVDLAWVAQGRLDATIMFANKPWDTAAGALIAREAGAAVVDQDGTPHTLRSTATIATAPALLEETLQAVADAQAAASQINSPGQGQP